MTATTSIAQPKDRRFIGSAFCTFRPKTDSPDHAFFSKLASALKSPGPGMREELSRIADANPVTAHFVLTTLREGKVKEVCLSLPDILPEIGIIEAFDIADSWERDTKKNEELMAAADKALRKISREWAPIITGR